MFLFLLALACTPEPAVRDTAPVTGPRACGVTLREPPMLGEDAEDLPFAVPHVPVLGADPEPWNMRRGIHDDPAYDATFLWQTDLGTLASRLALDGPDGAVSVDGASFPAADDSSRLHELHLCGLEPATTYSYRVGGRGAWSEDFEFTTAPVEADAEVRLVVLGDSRDDLKIWTQVLEQAADFEPDLLLHTGDVVALGGLQSLWDEFFAVSEGVLASTPMVVVHGNHEFMAPNFWGGFALPDAEQYFSVDWGALHLVGLNDMATGDMVQEQDDWLAQDLADNERAWPIGSHHQPTWTDGNHAANIESREDWNPLFEQHAPTLIVAGHNHLYERTVPILGEEQDEAGVTYLTIGGSGAPLYGTGSDWFLALTESVYHVLVLDMTSERLDAVAYRLDGSVLDSFSLER